jgi:hypothetical protein
MDKMSEHWQLCESQFEAELESCMQAGSRQKSQPFHGSNVACVHPLVRLAVAILSTHVPVNELLEQGPGDNSKSCPTCTWGSTH